MMQEVSGPTEMVKAEMQEVSRPVELEEGWRGPIGVRVNRDGGGDCH